MGVGEVKSLQHFDLKTDGPFHANFREIERGVSKKKTTKQKNTINQGKQRKNETISAPGSVILSALLKG